MVMHSPLLFPVRLKEDRIVVLDETELPFKEEYMQVDSLEAALWVLSEMKTRSLGQVFLFFYACVLFKDSVSIDEIAGRFKEKRPTFDFLLLAEIIKSGIKKGKPIREVVDTFIQAFDRLRKKRAQALAQRLPDPANILTICNVNGELIYLYDALRQMNKKCRFLVCETRPYLQGTRLTFWELNKNNIDCQVICDNQAAALMQQGRVSCIITGADRATTQGDIINKIGTYALACLGKHFNIPFYSLTQYPRDIEVDSIEIEQRPEHETFMYLQGDFSNIDAIYPAFDITRGSLISECMELKA